MEDNYKRIISASVANLYGGQHDDMSVEQLREELIGQVRASMERVFADLVLEGPGDPMQDGSFFFKKGSTTNFHYRNLSAGEKSAFDILLDLLIKRRTYNQTVYILDEPELHMHSQLQARFLQEYISLLPEGCQLWIATHSIGMMRKARELQEVNPDEVAFLDFHGEDFDQQVVIEPSIVNRDFWKRNLEVALDDFAKLVAPRQIVLCEGDSLGGGSRADFDSSCLRVIFADEFPETEFVSGGNRTDVIRDSRGVGHSIQIIVPGTKLVKLVDRDGASPNEVSQLEARGISVLSLRHLEAYLLADEVLAKLCQENGQSSKVSDLLNSKEGAIQNSIGRGNATDDVKSAAGEIFNAAKHLLGLTHAGNDTNSFLRDTVSPLVTSDLSTYQTLKNDIFGL